MQPTNISYHSDNEQPDLSLHQQIDQEELEIGSIPLNQVDGEWSRKEYPQLMPLIKEWRAKEINLGTWNENIENNMDKGILSQLHQARFPFLV